MRKYYKLTILILCLLISSFAIPNIVKADTFNSNTLIYTQYNDKADYYDNLTGISTFAINDDYIAYTLNNTDIIILNKATNQISQLFYGNSEFDTISDIWLTKNFLFVNDISGIRAYSLSDFTPASIVIDSQSALLSKYKDYSVAEDNDRIAIACINDKEFITYFYSPNDLKLISKYTNSALNYDECDLLNIATTTNKAFIITNSTDPDNTLWKINYSNNSVYSNALFPKSNITSFVVYTYTENQSTTDYLIATDNTTAIFVIRTDLLQKNIVDEDEGHDLTDQTRTGNPVKPNFTVKDISNPEYITVYNDSIFISDSGTKCIQELSFRLNSDNKGNIVGKSIVVASQCGEVGRFSQDSNIEFADNKIIVSDLNNSRIQIIEDGELNVLDYTTFSSPSEDNLKNLNTSILVNNILYFTSYNTSNTQQNLFAYNLDTNKLETLNQTSSIARIFDATSHSDKIYYLSSNGMFVLDTTKSTNNIKMLNPVVYSNTSRISCTDNNIIVANNKSINIYSFDGEVLSTLNISETIADIACNNSNIFTLCSENSSIMKFSISNNELSNTSETLSLNTNDSQYVTMTIDNATGIIYLFDNTDCKIDKVINPTFNFLANRGVFQANNKNVCIYDRPYFLNGIDTPNIIDKLNVNSRVNIYSTTSINYGNIEYYIMELPDGKYGYINRNDLTYLSNIINYEVIHPNATLRSFEDNATITVYSLPDTDSEIIATTDNGTRILIIDELSTDKFIYVKYYDANQNIIQGYVEANLVNHDDITEQQKIAIILAISSIVLLIIISIIITVIYKKKHTKK